MRYWVYINDKVVGPYDEEKLAELEGFTPDTLICTETAGAGGAQEWVKASSVFDFDEAPQTPPQPMNVASSAAPAQSQGFDSNALAAQLLAKIDQLTQEIEGMKGRLNEAVSAQEATSERLNELASRPVTPAERPIPAETPINETPLTNDVNNTPASVTDDAVVTSTDSLVQQAEQVVADAQHTEKKPVDFLDEIQIGENKDNLTEKSKGEDVVLLSALDSLYNSNVKEQTEEEKEQTFQDLLSPVKQAATAAAAGAAVTAAAASLSDTKQQPVEQTPAQQDTTPLTPQQREDLINEITTPVTQTDAISQAIDQAQQVQPEQYVTEVPVLDESVTAVQEVVQEAPVQEVPADVPTLDETAVATQEVAAEETPVQEAPADVPALDESAVATQEVVQETEAEQTPTNVISLDESEEAAEELVAQENLVEQTSEQAPADEQTPAQEETPEQQQTPEVEVSSSEEQEEELVLETPKEEEENKEDFNTQDLPDEPQPLDLSDQPELNIQDVEEDVPASAEPVEEIEPPLQAPQDVSLTPMDPNEQKEKTEAEEEEVQTVRELIPGKELEPEKEDGLISQKDLDEAFSEHENIASQQSLEVPATTTTSLPVGQEFYNPKEMTEVQLKEGSTYLISDFIPPAETGNKRPQMDEFVPGAAEPVSTPMEDDLAEDMEAVEEIVPQEDAKPQQDETTDDVTMSKVILENTIKTKRGATMDIKTVPMVKEPGDSDRLDLSDADLDLSAQHDMQSANAQKGSRLTKIILSVLISLVLLGALYVMLAYLGFMPKKYNMFKSSATQETQQEQVQAPAPTTNVLPQDVAQQQPAVNSILAILNEAKNYPLLNGQTLQQTVNARHPAAQGQIEWTIAAGVEPDNYSILAKIPPENSQSFRVSYRFNYNAVTKALDPTTSESKNLLDSVQRR